MIIIVLHLRAAAVRWFFLITLRSQTPCWTAYPKPYFNAALSAYILGLGTTMTVMHVFHAAQPALLYLRYVMSNFVVVSSAASRRGRKDHRPLPAH
jgi:hypothetical protein